MLTQTKIHTRDRAVHPDRYRTVKRTRNDIEARKCQLHLVLYPVSGFQRVKAANTQRATRNDRWNNQQEMLYTWDAVSISLAMVNSNMTVD